MGATRVGVYGGYRAVELAHERNGIQWLFQTYAWSDHRWYPPATLRQTHNNQQMAGGVVDLCWSTAPDIGQWSLLESHKPERVSDMFACKTPDDSTVWVSTGLRRRALHNWDSFLAMVSAGLIQRPTPGSDVDSSGWVFVVAGADLDEWAGPVDGGDVDQAAIQASAATGAKAGARGAITDDPQFASHVASAVVEGLGTLAGSLTLSGPITARFEPPQ